MTPQTSVATPTMYIMWKTWRGTFLSRHCSTAVRIRSSVAYPASPTIMAKNRLKNGRKTQPDVPLPVPRVDVQEVEHRAHRSHPGGLLEQHRDVLAGHRVVEDDAPAVPRGRPRTAPAAVDGHVARQVHTWSASPMPERTSSTRRASRDLLRQAASSARPAPAAEPAGKLLVLLAPRGELVPRLLQRALGPRHDLVVGAQVRRRLPGGVRDETEVLHLAGAAQHRQQDAVGRRELRRPAGHAEGDARRRPPRARARWRGRTRRSPRSARAPGAARAAVVQLTARPRRSRVSAASAGVRPVRAAAGSASVRPAAARRGACPAALRRPPRRPPARPARAAAASSARISSRRSPSGGRTSVTCTTPSSRSAPSVPRPCPRRGRAA